MIETAIEADEVLERLKQLQAQIAAAESERDAFISHYEAKIDAAKQICADKTSEAREQIAIWTEALKQFAQANLPENKKSITLPTGTLQFRKSSPQFFYDDLKPANAQNERLIHFVKHNARDYLKVKIEETVDWAKFKSKLEISEGGEVFIGDTGEIVDGLHAQILPDKFEVKMI